MTSQATVRRMRPVNPRSGYRWRHYATSSGRRPVRDFIEGLPDEDMARIQAQLRWVRREGLRAARHLTGPIYEVRVLGSPSYRVLFAVEGRSAQVLLTLHAFPKTSRKTPRMHIDLAVDRLRDWRLRGE